MDMIADPKLHKIGSEFAAEWVRRFKNKEEDYLFQNMLTSAEGTFTFRSPILRPEYQDAKIYVPMLRSVTKVLRGLTYHQIMVGTDTPSNTARVTLHFKATVHHEGKQYDVDGVDMFVVDGESKKATSLMVMIRPYKGATALRSVMHQHIVAFNKAFPPQSKL